MIKQETFDQLVNLLGSEEKAKAAIQLMDRRVTTKELTPKQQQVYDYLMSGKPVITQRQMAEACGLGDHPQKFAAVVTALVMKGYLQPADINVIDK